jgi:hypothetical protein
MPLYTSGRPALPSPAIVGQYVPLFRSNSLTSSNTYGNNTLRVAPFVVESSLTFDRIGAEIAVVGEAGSKLRLGIYADNGACYPGSVLLDAGQIAGDSATVQELTISTMTLAPGLYWGGAALQAAPTTQPTVRTVNATEPPVPVAYGTSLPAANSAITAYVSGSQSGALPATYPAGTFGGFAIARLFIRLA